MMKDEVHQANVSPEGRGSQKHVQTEGHKQVQVEEHDNQIVIWQHNDLWEESNEGDRGMPDEGIRMGCALLYEDANMLHKLGKR
ncbi:hypothetical protein V6N13_018749 [Hibiscus sabdariffa]